VQALTRMVLLEKRTWVVTLNVGSYKGQKWRKM